MLTSKGGLVEIVVQGYICHNLSFPTSQGMSDCMGSYNYTNRKKRTSRVPALGDSLCFQSLAASGVAVITIHY